VKVLDFGLAKAFDPTSSSGAGATISPTLSIHATQAGIILGTAAYMAPEQARGKTADKRIDIWAFGCVLFEMLTGRRVFDGDDISTTLAAVLKTEPDWQLLPPTTPTGLRRLLVRCLRKDPKDRLHAIADARIELGDVLSGVAEPATGTPLAPAARLWRRLAIPATTLLVGSLVTGAVVWIATRSTVARPPVSRFAITPPNATALFINGISRDVTITPDGSRLVYVGANATTLFVRPLDQLEPTPLVRGTALRDPFVSPDGQWVGFFEGPQTLKKVAISGGAALPVTRWPPPSAERGATWAADGTIIFAASSRPGSTTGAGLQRVSADGGAPTVLTEPDRARGEGAHRWPELMPDGQTVLFTVGATTTGELDAASIAMLDLRSGRVTVLLRGGSHAQYVPSGHLVYAAAGAMRAIRFDATRKQVVGPSIVVIPQVLTSGNGAIQAGLSRDGTLVYVTGAGSSSLRTFVWVDREGHETPIGAPPRAYLEPRISPDSTRIAATVTDQDRDIWIWDLIRATLTRLTADPAPAASPRWTPDSRRVVFSSFRAGTFGLFSQAADGTGVAERLTESATTQVPTSVSPDGKQVIFGGLFPKTDYDVMAVQLNAPHEVRPIVQTPFNEANGMLSPDGHWLVYEANDSGTIEVYVRPFPAVDTGHWQVSTSGGRQPVWAPSGHELFYFAPDGALMRVKVPAGPRWTPSAPTKVLEGRYRYVVGSGLVGATPALTYDVNADGQRFLMMKAVGGDASDPPPQIVVVQHFDEELKRLVPTK
jgi:serine/threonine-protein kinase